MILMGDEVARTQLGNNNTYCHDNELNWFDWRQVEANAELLRFVSNLVHFRRAHPVLRTRHHMRNADYVGSGWPDISWHGVEAWRPDWSHGSRRLAFMLDGRHAKGGTVHDDNIYVAMNMHWEACTFGLPRLRDDMQWHVFANSGAAAPEDIWTPGSEPVLGDQHAFFMGPRSVAILVGRARAGA
jgi:glycogen operon protein